MSNRKQFQKLRKAGRRLYVAELKSPYEWCRWCQVLIIWRELLGPDVEIIRTDGRTIIFRMGDHMMAAMLATIEHIKPLSAFCVLDLSTLANDLSNLGGACADCNANRNHEQVRRKNIIKAQVQEKAKAQAEKLNAVV